MSFKTYPCFFFFFNDTATTEIYTLSLHDALPIYSGGGEQHPDDGAGAVDHRCARVDRKSTRLNSSHVEKSYAVFCLKQKKKKWPPFKDPDQNTLSVSHHTPLPPP